MIRDELFQSNHVNNFIDCSKASPKLSITSFISDHTCQSSHSSIEHLSEVPWSRMYYNLSNIKIISGLHFKNKMLNRLDKIKTEK